MFYNEIMKISGGLNECNSLLPCLQCHAYNEKKKKKKKKKKEKKFSNVLKLINRIIFFLNA